MTLLGTAMKETSDVVDMYRKAARQQLPDVTTALATRPGHSMSSFSTDSSERYQFFRHWVYICVNSISSAVAGLPWKAAEITNAEENPESKRILGQQHKVPRAILEKAIGAQEVQSIASHPSLDMLGTSNGIHGKDELIYFTVANLEIVGCAYWILGTDDTDTEPRVFGVPATWMKFDRKSGNYLLRVAGAQEPVVIPSEYVAKMSFPNPSDPLGYYSPLNACLAAIKVDDYIQRSQQQSFDRGIHPNLIVTVSPTPGEKTRPPLHPSFLPDWFGSPVTPVATDPP